jgi:ABC-2 type transport system ATP-binding protein
MENSIISVKNLTKDYGNGNGVFDVSFDVTKGEVFGFLGPNGAGKTTTIRHIIGFSKPVKGTTSVFGLNSFTNQVTILKDVGYLPGEIALPENLTGNQFIKMMADLRGNVDMNYVEQLKKRFALNTEGKLKRMSLGNKRKLAIITAFMHNPSVLVLDEPTSGLDPLMQNTFIEFIREEKQQGKTILLSSHIFNEVEKLCDRVCIIKQGKIVSNIDLDEVKINKIKTYKIEFFDHKSFIAFKKSKFTIN